MGIGDDTWPKLRNKQEMRPARRSQALIYQNIIVPALTLACFSNNYIKSIEMKNLQQQERLPLLYNSDNKMVVASKKSVSPIQKNHDPITGIVNKVQPSSYVMPVQRPGFIRVKKHEHL